ILPQTPAGEDDWRIHLFIRTVLEDVANCPRPPSVDEADLLDCLAALDTVAVAYRTEMGRDLLNWLHEVAHQQNPEEVRWWMRRVKSPERPYLIFGAASSWDAAVQNAFSMFVALRHDQVFEAFGRDESLFTVGILLTPRYDGASPWDVTLSAVRGNLELDPEY